MILSFTSPMLHLDLGVTEIVFFFSLSWLFSVKT